MLILSNYWFLYSRTGTGPGDDTELSIGGPAKVVATARAIRALARRAGEGDVPSVATLRAWLEPQFAGYPGCDCCDPPYDDDWAELQSAVAAFLKSADEVEIYVPPDVDRRALRGRPPQEVGEC
jgi:hypothetical protein